MRSIPGSIAVVLAGLVGTPDRVANAQVMDAQEISKVRLIAEAPTAPAGQTVLLGLQFELAEHWHIYWDGRNDTGFPPSVQWDLPEGVSVGPMLWPAPMRYVSPGNILDHVYEGTPTILVPLTIGADVPPGTTLTIAGQVEWLVCNEVCLPGFGPVSVDLEVAPVSDEPPAKLASGPIARAIARLPVPVMDPSQIEGLDLTWSEDVVGLRLDASAGVSFYPMMESTSLVSTIEDADAKSPALRLRLAPPDRDMGTGGERRLIGVVEGRTPGRNAVAYLIDFGPDGLRSPRDAGAIRAAQRRLASAPAWWPAPGAR